MDRLDQNSLPNIYKAIKIIVNGRVQGVGFRPFIFQIADKYQIKGTVQNNMDGVLIMAEGKSEMINLFINDIKQHPPRLSRIDRVLVEEKSFKGFKDFTIIPSERTGKSSIVIPVDSAVCDDCLEEMQDPNNFRFRYPFINCTQCGPRYTIIDELPYDRPYTTMKSFDMCNDCKEEYIDPTNRRHHAQPIACSDCGPSLHLYSIHQESIAMDDQAIKETILLLSQGYIVAIKGLGGYHLACDARNEKAISKLRSRKKRPNRPLAVMAANIEVAKKYCYVSSNDEHVLKSPESPIVILDQIERNEVPIIISPGINTLGVMLPYTPLHHLLFEDNQLELLVMTSANPSGLPILFKDNHAFSYLKDIADFILTNDREILHPLDDSVVKNLDDKIHFYRRSRGYVPDAINTVHSVHGIIALGGQQKNTFAIGRNEQIFIGPHIGDMGNIEISEFFIRELHHLKKWMGIDEKIIAIDKHPNYTTTILGKEMNKQVIPVQHHHAHHVACMEDNHLDQPTFGIILDGTGYGEDGNIWGFEILYGDARSFQRIGHLKYTPLPGGEKAVKEPWRNAVGMIIGYFGKKGKVLAKEVFHDHQQEIDIISNMIDMKVNSPMAGTCGRLFDAVSAILNICRVSTYDGEAAVRLSGLMPKDVQMKGSYPYLIHKNEKNLIEIDFAQTIHQIIHDYLNHKEPIEISQLFHRSIVSAIVDVFTIILKEKPRLNKNVVLSGGSFHNPYLLIEIKKRLTDMGFQVYTHNKLPCNDGGLALGQLIVAANQRESI